jgi:hypothetical protein
MMNQKKMLQLLSAGRTKIDQAHRLIHSDKREDKELLLTLREWLYQNADIVKNSLQNDRFVDEVRRQTLERLLHDYTITIFEIDDKINRDNLFVKM